jgi:hypothetical protein
MNSDVTAVIGIAIVIIFVYVLYVPSIHINIYPSTNRTICSNDVMDPLEQFRRTHLREYVIGYSSERGYPTFDYIARTAKYILIGTSVTEGTEYRSEGINYPAIYAVIDVGQELTGNFKGDRMELSIGRLDCHFAGIYYGDRILAFVTEPDPILAHMFGDAYFLPSIAGIYKIVDGRVYGYYCDGMPLEDFIKIIQDARRDRIKDLAINTDYALLGRIKGIEKVSTSLEIPEVSEYTLSANVTVEVDNAIPDYEGKEFTFFAYTDVIQDCKYRLCLFFVKHGTHEDEVYKHLPTEMLNKLAEYYLYPTWSVNDGVYIVMDDGRAYGKECPE